MPPEITIPSGVLWFKRVLGAHFPAGYGGWQPAWGVEWEREPFSCSSNRKDTVWVESVYSCRWCCLQLISCWQYWTIQFSWDRQLLLHLLWTCSAYMPNYPKQKTNPAWTSVCICCWEVVSSSFSLLKKKIILTSPRSQASTFPSPLIQELSREVSPVSKNESYKSDSSRNTSYCPSNITAPGCWAGCGIELDLVLLLKLSSLKRECVFANICAAKTPIQLC